MKGTFFLFAFLLASICSASSETIELILCDEDPIVFYIKSQQEQTRKNSRFDSDQLGGVGGFRTPAAWMRDAGDVSLSYARSKPYQNTNVNIQLFDRFAFGFSQRHFEKGLNYKNDHCFHFRWQLCDFDAHKKLPALTLGIEDPIEGTLGTKKFARQYLVMSYPLEGIDLSVGYGGSGKKGLFAHAYLPFWQKKTFAAAALLEWDRDDGVNSGRRVYAHSQRAKTRVNYGIKAEIDRLVSLAAFRQGASDWGLDLSLNAPMGKKEDWVPKNKDQPYYQGPINWKNLGEERDKTSFAKDLAQELHYQGFETLGVYCKQEEDGSYSLLIHTGWQKWYWYEDALCRWMTLMALYKPQNVSKIFWKQSSLGLESSQILVTQELFSNFLRKKILWENLSSYVESCPKESSSSWELLYQSREKLLRPSWQPQVFNVLGGEEKGFETAVGLSGAILALRPLGSCGALLSELRLNYWLESTISKQQTSSELLQVRADAGNYFQKRKLLADCAYIQWQYGLKADSAKQLVRFATGYFEKMYGGVGAEFLAWNGFGYWNWGLSWACLKKRQIDGFSFISKIEQRNEDGQLNKMHNSWVQQGFIHIYSPKIFSTGLEFDVSLGKFLAGDWGANCRASREFQNGFSIGAWLTVTNTHERVLGHRYYDHGLQISFPLMLSKEKNVPGRVSYKLVSRLCNNGAKSQTGMSLYEIMQERDRRKHTCYGQCKKN